MDDALESDHGEKPGAEARQPGQKQDGEGQERLPARRLRQPAGQASAPAATCSRGVGSSIARDGSPRARARFVLALGGGVLLRHVLESVGQESFPAATRPAPARTLPGLLRRLTCRGWSPLLHGHRVLLLRII